MRRHQLKRVPINDDDVHLGLFFQYRRIVIRWTSFHIVQYVYSNRSEWAEYCTTATKHIWWAKRQNEWVDNTSSDIFKQKSNEAESFTNIICSIHILHWRKSSAFVHGVNELYLFQTGIYYFAMISIGMTTMLPKNHVVKPDSGYWFYFNSLYDKPFIVFLVVFWTLNFKRLCPIKTRSSPTGEPVAPF